MNNGKICFNKRYIVAFVILFIIVGSVVYLNNIFLSNKTTYKSRAAAPQMPNAIFGGTLVTDPAKWPFIVKIFHKYGGLASRPFEDGICTGTLIAPHWVLTAGHCVTKGKEMAGDPLYSETELAVFVGGVDVSLPSNGSIYNVKKVIRNEQYGIPDAYNNDIALLQLDRDVYYSGTTKTISLNGDTNLEQEKTCVATGGLKNCSYNYGVIMGFGLTENDGLVAQSKLHQAVVPILSNERVMRNGWFSGYTMKSTEIPVGYPLGKVGPCSGDSGGPLIVWDSFRSQWVQVGIANWIVRCGGLYSPGVYIRVSSFISWIEKKTTEKTCLFCPSSSVDPNKGTFTSTGGELTPQDLQMFNCRINGIGPTPIPPTIYTCGHELN